MSCCVVVFFCKQKTAYEMRISDWSSDVCSSDLLPRLFQQVGLALQQPLERLAVQPDHFGLDRRADRGGALAAFDHRHLADIGAGWKIGEEQIGRASCRERVCQYV